MKFTLQQKKLKNGSYKSGGFHHSVHKMLPQSH